MDTEQLKKSLQTIDAAIMASYGANHDATDALVALEQIKQVLTNAVNTQKSGNCRFCGDTFRRIRYRGYYDTFYFWDCGCDDNVPIVDEFLGSYC